MRCGSVFYIIFLYYSLFLRIICDSYGEKNLKPLILLSSLHGFAIHHITILHSQLPISVHCCLPTTAIYSPMSKEFFRYVAIAQIYKDREIDKIHEKMRMAV